MGLNNVAVRWPRTGRFYDPVPPAEFAQFAELARQVPEQATATIALAERIAASSTAPVTAYIQLVDLLLGLEGVLYATDADSDADDEDPVIDPDGCAWVAGGLERFLTGHLAMVEAMTEAARAPSVDGGQTAPTAGSAGPAPLDVVTFASVGAVMRRAIEGTRLAEQQLAWLTGRLDALRDAEGAPPRWWFELSELGVLAKFYRTCSDRGFAVYADQP